MIDFDEWEMAHAEPPANYEIRWTTTVTEHHRTIVTADELAELMNHDELPDNDGEWERWRLEDSLADVENTRTSENGPCTHRDIKIGATHEPAHTCPGCDAPVGATGQHCRACQ